MERQGDTLILEMGRCGRCLGNGTTYEFRPCPLQGKAVNRLANRRCPHCDATRKHDHHQLRTGNTPVCSACNGTKVEPEDRYDNLPTELFNAIPMKVYPSDRGISFNEAYLGRGCVWSCQDYGAHKTLTDDELIAKVREKGHGNQACKVVNKDMQFCDHIGVFTNDQGYSLRAIFPGDMPDPSREVSTETMIAGGRNTFDILK